MKPKSDNLFHFTKSIDVLKIILKNGIEPRYCLEDNEWLGFDVKHFAFPMSCFCDIPLSRISDHTDFYGSFGLGLTKEWGLKNNLNPVIYTTSDGRIQKLTKFLLDQIDDDIEEKEESDLHAYSLWSHIKPISGKMLIAGKFVEKEFYQESEWRFVPPVENLIQQKNFEKDKANANKKVSKFALKFTPSDIRYIFVNSDANIPSLVDFINTELGHFSLNDLKILLSRIVSLETLSNDL